MLLQVLSYLDNTLVAFTFCIDEFLRERVEVSECDPGELLAVLAALQLGPERVEQGHVVRLAQQLLLQQLEDGQCVAEQNLQVER